jgi:hypothetical protein
MFKPSGNPKVRELTKTVRDRSYPLSLLKVIKLPELSSKGKPKRMCAWCVVMEIFHGNAKYCCQECQNSALAWSYPQKEDGLRYLLIRQNFKCLGCQYDYLPALMGILGQDKHYSRCFSSTDFNPNTISWYCFKRLKRKTPKEFRPEVDHVLVIRHGGTALGIDNHQILCFTCHKIKTAKDISGKRGGKP